LPKEEGIGGGQRGKPGKKSQETGRIEKREKNSRWQEESSNLIREEKEVGHFKKNEERDKENSGREYYAEV